MIDIGDRSVGRRCRDSGVRRHLARPRRDFAALKSPATEADRSTLSTLERGPAVRAFNDLTGPAGEALVIKMEKATSHEQLAPLLQTAHQIIGNSRGAQAATAFKARFASF